MKNIIFIYLMFLLFHTNALALPYSVTGVHLGHIDYADIEDSDHYQEIMQEFRSEATKNAEKQCIGEVRKVSDWKIKHDRSNSCGHCTLFRITVKADFLCLP